MIGLYLCVLPIIIFEGLVSFSFPFETIVLNSLLKKGTLLDHDITRNITEWFLAHWTAEHQMFIACSFVDGCIKDNQE